LQSLWLAEQAPKGFPYRVTSASLHMSMLPAKISFMAFGHCLEGNRHTAPKNGAGPDAYSGPPSIRNQSYSQAVPNWNGKISYEDSGSQAPKKRFAGQDAGMNFFIATPTRWSPKIGAITPPMKMQYQLRGHFPRQFNVAR
jgi:hypothetical protein